MSDFSQNSAGPIGTAYEITIPARMLYAEPDVIEPARKQTRRASACFWSAPKKDPVKSMTDEEFWAELFG